MIKLLVAVVLLALLFVVAIGVASETGGEVVTLHTRDADGGEVSTSLWLVEHGGQLYLRAGQQGSGWLERLKAESRVEMERAGQRRIYRAVEAEDVRDPVNELMAEKYGWADAFIGVMRDDSQTVPVRLDPVQR